MTGHTPGPWKVLELDGELYVNPERGKHGQDEYALIARVQHKGRPSYEANARLIAAAPALLEALKGLSEWVSDNHAGERWLADTGEWLSYEDLPDLVTARAALAAAGGHEGAPSGPAGDSEVAEATQSPSVEPEGWKNLWREHE